MRYVVFINRITIIKFFLITVVLAGLVYGFNLQKNTEETISNYPIDSSVNYELITNPFKPSLPK